MEPRTLIIHTDGGARGNPGPAATGVVILHQDEVVHAFGRYLGTATNNEAEYQAVIDALQWIVATYPETPPKLSFNLDSNLVVQQLSGKFKIKEPRLQVLAQTAWQLIKNSQLSATFSYVPRAANWQADRQVNIALDKEYARASSNNI